MNIGEPVEIVEVELAPADAPEPYTEQPTESPEVPAETPVTVGGAARLLVGP